MLQAGIFMPQSVQKNHRQTIISYALIILLILIAAAIGLKQQSYEKTASQDIILSDNLFGSDLPPAGKNAFAFYSLQKRNESTPLDRKFVPTKYPSALC